MTWADVVVDGIQRALLPMADAEKAPAMRAYMKDIAPFLGIQATERRRALRGALAAAGPPPDDAALAMAARSLFALPEREYAYAACDVIARYEPRCSAGFLADPIEELLTTAPWWDSVDALGNAAVSPLCHRFPELRHVVLRWSDSGDLWLIRAAIQHQRGWRDDTDVRFVLSLCAEHAAEGEFFIQKAIGWALRDLARLDAAAVAGFVSDHPELTRTATREAESGLRRG